VLAVVASMPEQRDKRAYAGESLTDILRDKRGNKVRKFLLLYASHAITFVALLPRCIDGGSADFARRVRTKAEHFDKRDCARECCAPAGAHGVRRASFSRDVVEMDRTVAQPPLSCFHSRSLATGVQGPNCDLQNVEKCSEAQHHSHIADNQGPVQPSALSPEWLACVAAAAMHATARCSPPKARGWRSRAGIGDGWKRRGARSVRMRSARWLRDWLKSSGGIDIVFANASVGGSTSLGGTDPSVFEAVTARPLAQTRRGVRNP
jgi:hypothetical protein